MTDLRKLLTEGEIKKAHHAVIEDDYLWQDLIGFLDDSDESIQRAAFEVIAEAGAHPNLIEALPLLISGIQSGEKDITRYAAESRYHLGPDAAEAMESLSELLGHDDSYDRRSAARALRSIGSAAGEIKEYLIDALSDRYEVVRGEASLAIGNIGEEASEAIPRLVQLLVDEEEFEQDGKGIEVREAA